MKLGWFETVASAYQGTHPLSFYDERSINDLQMGASLDVFIPIIEKDLHLLPHCIAALRKNLHHPIGKISIIAPPAPELLAAAKNLEITFINDNDLLPNLDRGDIQFYSSAGEDRRGWIMQQLFKLCVDEITDKEYYFIIDADTILTRKQSFTKNGKTVFLQNDAIRKEYFHVNRRVLGFGPQNYWSFVSHQMLFKVGWVADMKRSIEERQSDQWYRALIANLERRKGLGMSEYELYGNWCLKNYPLEVMCVNWENYEVKNGSVMDAMKNEGNFRSVSQHSYFEVKEGNP